MIFGNLFKKWQTNILSLQEIKRNMFDTKIKFTNIIHKKEKISKHILYNIIHTKE